MHVISPLHLSFAFFIIDYGIDKHYYILFRKLVIDPLTAPIVLEVFKRYAAGETVRSIIESLNDRNLKTRSNKPFSPNSFIVLLKNRKYIGEYRYRDVVIPDGVPAIVSEELFNRVQTRLEKNKRAPARAKAHEEFLLTTKLFCGKCGRMMVGESGTSHTGKIYYYYKCGASKRKKGCTKKAVKKEWIENLIVQKTTEMIFDDPLMERLINKLLEAQGKENSDIAILKKQLSDLERGIENLLNAIQAGIVTSSTKKRLEDLEFQKTETETSLALAELKNPSLTREQISFFIYRFRECDISDQIHRQRLIDSFVNSVYVFDDRIVLTFNYKEGSQTISLEGINSSDIVGGAPPNLNRNCK